ncbi:hypothetical protein EDB89DRAFT_1916599 [Lactarius sanguifluus]|nr:hypothetical protein EDB89DRAFT_1916599 [Lactarius sanguifluus]
MAAVVARVLGTKGNGPGLSASEWGVDIVLLEYEADKSFSVVWEEIFSLFFLLSQSSSGYCPVPQATKKKQFQATTTPTSVYMMSSATLSYATSSRAFSRMSAIELFTTTPGTPALVPSIPSLSTIGGGGAAAAWKWGQGGFSHSRGPATCTSYDDSDLTAAAPNHTFPDDDDSDSDEEVNSTATAPKPSYFWYNLD